MISHSFYFAIYDILFKPYFKQECPDVWTQEAYRPPRSKSLGGTYLGQG